MDFLFLSQTALFRGCSPRETADMLQCLRAERRVYEKDRVICHAGTPWKRWAWCSPAASTSRAWTSGAAGAFWAMWAPGRFLPETYACLPGEPLMVDAVAASAPRCYF